MDKMIKDNELNRLLKEAFSKIPEERLPEGFRGRLMEKVIHESEKARVKEERLSLIATIIASLMMIAATIITIIYMNIDWISLPKIVPSLWHFYLYIAGIAMLLLFVDYRIRRIIHRSTESNKRDTMA